MIDSILQAVIAVFKTIPIFSDWVKKYEIDKEQKEREKIDEAHDKGKETGRPVDDFWDKRHL